MKLEYNRERKKERERERERLYVFPGVDYNTLIFYTTDDREKNNPSSRKYVHLASSWTLLCLYSDSVHALFIGDIKNLGLSCVQQPRIRYVIPLCHQKLTIRLPVPTTSMTVTVRPATVHRRPWLGKGRGLRDLDHGLYHPPPQEEKNSHLKQD